MKKCLVIILLCVFANAKAQHNYFSVHSLQKDVALLASDSFGGRGNFTAGIEMAADFISGEFKKFDLQYFPWQQTYLQKFTLPYLSIQPYDLIINGQKSKAPIFVYVHEYSLIDSPVQYFNVVNLQHENKASVIAAIKKNLDNITGPTIFQLRKGKKMVAHVKKNYHKVPASFTPVVFVEEDGIINSAEMKLNAEVQKKIMQNIVGILPGKTKPDEVVLISAHYDHVGKGRAINGDSIFNGANDNATGTAAMLAYMKHFASANNNVRTIMFVAFAGEELGLFGSYHLAKFINPNKLVAVFNLEMLGQIGHDGAGSVQVLAHDKSSLMKIMQVHCNSIKINPDGFPKENLLMRSDHYPFIRRKIPAITFICFSPGDKHYHQRTDETSTIQFSNYAQLVQGLLPGVEAVVSGNESPVFY